jgi:hypothetical protein
MILTADIKYKNNFQQGALKGEDIFVLCEVFLVDTILS